MCIKKLVFKTCRTDIAPFLPKPDVVTSSRSGSTELPNSSDRNAGSPIMHWPQGPVEIEQKMHHDANENAHKEM